MLSIHTLCSGMENKILFRTIGREWTERADGLLMPDGGKLSPHYLYFCDAALAAKTLAQRDAEAPLTLFVAGAMEEYPAPSPGLNLVVMAVTLAELYNRLREVYRRTLEWDRRLSDIPKDAGAVKLLLRTAAELSGPSLSLYLMTPAFRLAEACETESEMARISRRLSGGGCLTEAQIAQCFDLADSAGGEGKSKIAYRMYPVEDSGGVHGYLLVIGSTGFSGFDELIRLLLRELSSRVASPLSDVGPDRSAVSKLLEDLFLFLPEDIAGLRSRLEKLPNKPGQYIRTVVMSFADEVSMPGVLAELDEIFPGGCVAPYASFAVALVSGDSNLFIPEYDAPRLEALLKKRDGFAVISNAGRFLRGLRTLFIQCKDTLPLLPKLMGFEPEKRCVYFESMREYYVIDLCAQVIQEHYGHDRLVYLAHPAVMELMRYDMRHNTDLRDFLFLYIANDCSVLATAQKLHMHRNTVLYKLRKIQELLKLDLRDFTLRRELLFSCQVMQYTERVQSRKFSISNSVGEE